MMFKNYKLFILTILLILTLAHPAMAALEVQYPPLSFGGSPFKLENSSGGLINYIRYVFVFLVVTAGIMGVISIAISGLRILFTAGNPESISAARERIFGAILGIVLLMTSVIILQTINPDIVRQDPPDDKAGSVWYAGQVSENHPEYDPDMDGWIYTQAPEAEVDIWQNTPTEYQYLFYYCKTVPSKKRLLLWKYMLPNFKIDWADGAHSETKELACNSWVDLNEFRSFKWAYKEPGIYFYNKENCQGISTMVQKSSGNIPPFDSNVNYVQHKKSMQIVTDIEGLDPRVVYGAILSANVQLGGKCSRVFHPLYDDGTVQAPGKCIDFYSAYPSEAKFLYAAKYAQVVNFDTNISLRPDDSVKFYSKDFVAEIKQRSESDRAIAAPVLRIPVVDSIKDIGNILWIDNNDPNDVLPHRILELSTLNPAGRGYRHTPPYSDSLEEQYAGGVVNASTYFEGSSPGSFNFWSTVNPFSSGSHGLPQCKDPDRECIRAVQHNGLYYTILYALNRFTGEYSCSVIGGSVSNIRVELESIRRNDRIIYRIAIIPTTP